MFDVLRRKKGMALKLSIDRVVNKEHFSGNHAENVHQKLVPNPFLILANNKKTAIACKKLFQKYDILKEDYQEDFNFNFNLSNPLPFNG